jgi:hypothetical protein
VVWLATRCSADTLHMWCDSRIEFSRARDCFSLRRLNGTSSFSVRASNRVIALVPLLNKYSPVSHQTLLVDESSRNRHPLTAAILKDLLVVASVVRSFYP